MEINEIEMDLKIDLNALHEEWLKQPSLYMKYSDLAAQAARTRDQLKERIDVVRAEIDNEIRENLGGYNCPTDKGGAFKPTEAWINATIQRQNLFQNASEAYHAANYVANLLKGAITAFDHRKKALEMEVMLWQAGYWSTPYEGSTNKVEKQAAGVASDKQREGLTRRKRG
jgi:hypothetical protein